MLNNGVLVQGIMMAEAGDLRDVRFVVERTARRSRD
jgi:hypothetical protein